MSREAGNPWNGIWSNTITNAKSGDQYKFVLRWLGTNSDVYQLDPRSMRIAPDGRGSLNSVIYDQTNFAWGINKTSPIIPFNQMVMYEMHVGTFYDPNPNDNQPGTFDNAISRLPYLQRLGVNVIALMPVAEFFTERSWGYNPQYPFAIEESYGGPDGLKRFVREAHRLGMKVQLDVVHNHYGSAGETVELMQFAGTNSYFYSSNIKVGRTKWGPRPSYADTNVRSFIRDNIRMFLDDYGIDGFRWDSPGNFVGYDNSTNNKSIGDVGDPDTCIPEGKSLMMEINRMIHEQYPDHWSIAEDADLLTVRPDGNWYPQGGFLDSLRVNDGADSFDGHWQTSFHNIITPQIASNNPNVTWIQGKVTEWSEPPGYRVIFTDNHDKSGDLNQAQRLANRMVPSDPTGKVARKKTLLNAALTLTAPGTPMIWMGQEFRATGTFNDGVRMNWREASSQHRIFRAHRDLIDLRELLPALQNSDLNASTGFIDDELDWMAYWRLGARNEENLVVLFNFSNQDRTISCPFPTTGAWYVQFNSDWGVYGTDFANIGPFANMVTASFVGDGSSVRANVMIAAYSVLVLARTPAPNERLTEDSNANGLADGWEAMFGVASTNADDDSDGLSNSFEIQNGLDPLEKDTATVVLDGVTNSLRAESNNPNVQFILWATKATTISRAPTYSFLSNTVTGAALTNPAGGYLRLALNLTNLTSNSATFFTPNSNLAVADVNRTNWAKFYGVTNFNDNPDGDAFSNLQEFARGSDPYASNPTAFYLAGIDNGWNESSRPMTFLGGRLWVCDVPGTKNSTLPFQITDGTWTNNWGDSLPADGIADFKGTDILVNISTNGVHRFQFDEASLAYQVTYDASDANNDGIQDAWVAFYGLIGLNAASTADPDQDGISNLFEFQNGLNPNQKDTATVVLDGVTNSLQSESNNPNVQFIFWATKATTNLRFPTYTFISNTITGTTFTNPAGGYLRLALNLTNLTSNSAAFFTPNSNLAVADVNRTNWAKFYGVTNFNDNPDGDAFSNLQEFARGSDPYASNRATTCLAGRFNNWNASANPMSFAGGGLWVGYAPGRQGASEEFQFTDGTWDNNWGDNPPTNSIADYKGTNITVSYSNGNGMYRFAFDESTLAYQVGYDSTDANGDGIQDAWISYYGLTGSNASATADPDADGWSNLAEFKRFTNANGSFMHPGVSDSATSPKRMTVTGSMAPLPFWQPNANNMTWSDQRMQWEWTGIFASSTNLQFKFSQASAADWSGGDSWGWNVGASNAGTAIRSGSNNILAPVTNGVRYRFGFNDLSGIYTISNYPVSSEWWESNGLSQPLPINSSDSRWAQDTDGDGNSQLMEYSLGGNPMVPETNRLISSWATNSAGSNRLVLQWVERTNGESSLQITPVVGTNLAEPAANWISTFSSSSGVDQTGVGSNFVRKQAFVPIDATNRKFLRLKVTGP